MRKFLKSTMEILLTGVLLIGNTGYAQAAQEQATDTITKNVVSETAFVSQKVGKQQSKAVVQAKSKKSANAAYNKKAKKAYKKFLKKYFLEHNTAIYQMYDINNDGKNELILSTEVEVGWSSPEALFIYDKGKVKKIGNSGYMGHYFGFKKGNLVGECYRDYVSGIEVEEGYTTEYYIIKNGKLKSVAKQFDNGGWVLDEDSKIVHLYWIGKKKVSKKKFDNFIKKKTGSKNPKMKSSKSIEYK